MKLAEGLLLRADLQKKYERIKERLTNNAKIQEGDKPAEDPKDLLRELDRVLTELTSLIQRINKTNTSALIDQGSTISDYLTRRDIIKYKHAALIALADAATVKLDRYSKSEVKYRATIDVADIQRQADQLAKEIRQIDTKIQAANWAQDIIEQ
jgi:hypothetical protein